MNVKQRHGFSCKIWASVIAPLLMLLIFAGQARGLSKEDILFYLPMDGSADAQISTGDAKARIYGKLEFAEGKRGKGYLAGGPECALGYFSEKNISVTAGTVAMWVKPLGWSHSKKSRNPDMRWWFRAGEANDARGVGEGSFLWLYKLKAHVPVYWLVQHDYRQRAFYYTGTQSAWKSGKWMHIAGTWSGPVMRLYVNGRRTGTARTPTPTVLRNFGRRFMIGAPSWAKRPDCVIDEVYILRRPLCEAEMLSLAKLGPDAFTKGAFPPKMDIQGAYFPTKEQLKVQLMVNGRHPDDIKGLSATLTILDRNRARPTMFDAVARPLQTVNSNELLDTRDLPPGKYSVIVSLSDKGRITSQNSADFEKPDKPEWLGNKIGVPKKVPSPWTPLIKKDGVLQCWGRKITYGNSLFPTQITSGETELLARPIALIAKVNGKTVEPKNVWFKWTKVTELRAEFKGSATLGDVPVKVSGWMEFDGLLWTRLTIPVKAGAHLEHLRMEVPLRSETATLQHGGLRMHFQPRDGKVYAWKFPILWQPFIWLGNEEVGLQWSTGDDYSWHNSKKNETMSLKPGAKEVLLTANFVDGAIPLDRPLSYTLGLQATPVKPLPANWREYHKGFAGVKIEHDKQLYSGYAVFYQRWNKQTAATPKGVFGYQAPGGKTRELIAKSNANSVKPLLYWNVNSVWRGAPAYRAFRSEWHPDNPPALPYETCPGRTAGKVWRTVPSYQDWAVWRYHKTLKENPWLVKGIAGLYNDVVQGFWGVEPLSDRNGIIRTRHELLGVRELQKRFYVFMQNEFPGKLLVNHQSGDTHMSQLAFAHAYITGENYRGTKQVGEQLGYYDVLDLDTCRAILLGAKWGVPVVFLPEIWGGDNRLFKKALKSEAGMRGAEHLAGLLLLHDSTPWSAYVHPLPFIRVGAMKELFGWGEKTKYTGYWKSSPLAKLESKQSPVVVSVFTRPGKAMFVVFNDSDKEARATLSPNWKRLGITAPEKLLDGYTAPEIPDGILDVRKYGQGKLIFHPPREKRKTVYVPVKSGKAEFIVPKRNFRALIAQ